MSRHRELLDTAAHLGHVRYVELAAFGALGRRAVSAELPSVALYLAGAARAHAWRAALFEELLPVSLGLPGAVELTVSPHHALDEALSVLVADGDDEGLMAALCAVLYPAMLAEYRAFLERARPVSDAPGMRAATRASADLVVHSREGSALAGTLGSSPERARELQRLLAIAGGVFGVPVTSR